MDRQAFFKKICKVLIPIEIVFLITSAIAAGVIFYLAFDTYIKTHEVDMYQFQNNLLLIFIIFAVFSIIAAFPLSSGFPQKNKIKKIAKLAIIIFFTLILSILLIFTVLQIRYFPLIFFGSGILTIICSFLALTPNGIRAKLKQYINFKKNGA